MITCTFWCANNHQQILRVERTSEIPANPICPACGALPMRSEFEGRRLAEYREKQGR